MKPSRALILYSDMPKIHELSLYLLQTSAVIKARIKIAGMFLLKCQSWCQRDSQQGGRGNREHTQAPSDGVQSRQPCGDRHSTLWPCTELTRPDVPPLNMCEKCPVMGSAALRMYRHRRFWGRIWGGGGGAIFQLCHFLTRCRLLRFLLIKDIHFSSVHTTN